MGVQLADGMSTTFNSLLGVFSSPGIWGWTPRRTVDQQCLNSWAFA